MLNTHFPIIDHTHGEQILPLFLLINSFRIRIPDLKSDLSISQFSCVQLGQLLKVEHVCALRCTNSPGSTASGLLKHSLSFCMVSLYLSSAQPSFNISYLFYLSLFTYLVPQSAQKKQTI